MFKTVYGYDTSIPLLTSDDEQRLGKLIVAGRASDATDAQRQAALEARDAMVNANTRLVIKIAGRFTEMTLDDAVQEGMIGLLRAIEKWEPSKGFKFSTYATWWIRQSITRSVINSSRMIRLPVHMSDRLFHIRRIEGENPDLSHADLEEKICNEAKVTLRQLREIRRINRMQATLSLQEPIDEDFTLEDALPSGENTEEEVIDSMLALVIQAQVARLTQREGVVLTLRYGLNGGRQHTLEEVGKHIGVTRERARQIEREALCRLRQCSEDLRNYL